MSPKPIRLVPHLVPQTCPQGSRPRGFNICRKFQTSSRKLGKPAPDRVGRCSQDVPHRVPHSVPHLVPQSCPPKRSTSLLQRLIPDSYNRIHGRDADGAAGGTGWQEERTRPGRSPHGRPPASPNTEDRGMPQAGRLLQSGEPDGRLASLLSLSPLWPAGETGGQGSVLDFRRGSFGIVDSLRAQRNARILPPLPTVRASTDRVFSWECPGAKPTPATRPRGPQVTEFRTRVRHEPSDSGPTPRERQRWTCVRSPAPRRATRSGRSESGTEPRRIVDRKREATS